MQGGLSRTDARLLWGALTIGVLVTGGSAVLLPSERGPESPVPSSYSRDARGALAAYLLLDDQHFPIRRWNESPSTLPKDAPGTVLILAEPLEDPTTSDRDGLRTFLQSGGRILFCGPNIGKYLEAPLTLPVGVAEWKEYPAAIPSPFTRGADRVEMEASGFWPAAGGTEVRLYGTADQSPIVTWKVDQGEVLWWASATPLTNAGIPSAGNLRLFMNAVTDAQGSPLTVYWDEYFHGQQRSLWTYVAKTPFPWGLVQAGLLMLAVVFTFSRRSGPIVKPAIVSRLSPLEFVETMGGLYRNAAGGRIAVEGSYRRLQLELTRRLHLPVTTPHSELAKAAATRLRWSEAELVDAFRSAEQTLALKKVGGKTALASVRQLEGFVRRLKNPRLSVEATLEEIKS